MRSLEFIYAIFAVLYVFMYVRMYVSEHESALITVHSIALRFGMHITGHCLIYCIDLGEFRINSLF